MTNSTGLIVLGMHRSGTSALTGALQECGAFVGQDRELTGSNKENPKGFFERRDVRNICDILLYSANSDWWKISDFEINKVEQNQLEQQRQAFSETINHLSQNQTWIIKEPRLCLVLPLMIDLIKNPICLFVYRNPIEVAKSLRTRNNISLQQGVALWEKYTTCALNSTRGLTTLYVSYNDLVEKPLETLSLIVYKLSAFGVQGLSSPTSSFAFIDKTLHRSHWDRDEMELLNLKQLSLWQHVSSTETSQVTFDNETNRAQYYVLKDLEEQYIKNHRNTLYLQSSYHRRFGLDLGLEQTAPELSQNLGVRSRKVLNFCMFLDKVATFLTSLFDSLRR